jgi:hypothetical protein
MKPSISFIPRSVFHSRNVAGDRRIEPYRSEDRYLTSWIGFEQLRNRLTLEQLGAFVERKLDMPCDVVGQRRRQTAWR